MFIIRTIKYIYSNIQKFLMKKKATEKQVIQQAKKTDLSTKYPLFLLLAFIVVLIWSGINPHDYFTWFLEVIPALIGLTILLATYKRFKFTNLTYTFIFIQACILCLGGHTTYAEMPLFNWLRDTFDLQRNYYDRVGHFFQGFTPALVAYEILLRKKIFAKLKWIPFTVVCICLAASAFYEFFEWGTAVAIGSAADAFLGTQGDVWDTQWDMFMALWGALLAMLLLRRQLDKAIAEKFPD
jgi:putative membrane protein